MQFIGVQTPEPLLTVGDSCDRWFIDGDTEGFVGFFLIVYLIAHILKFHIDYRVTYLLRQWPSSHPINHSKYGWIRLYSNWSYTADNYAAVLPIEFVYGEKREESVAVWADFQLTDRRQKIPIKFRIKFRLRLNLGRCKSYRRLANCTETDEYSPRTALGIADRHVTVTSKSNMMPRSTFTSNRCKANWDPKAIQIRSKSTIGSIDRKHRESIGSHDREEQRHSRVSSTIDWSLETTMKMKWAFRLPSVQKKRCTT